MVNYFNYFNQFRSIIKRILLRRLVQVFLGIFALVSVSYFVVSMGYWPVNQCNITVISDQYGTDVHPNYPTVESDNLIEKSQEVLCQLRVNYLIRTVCGGKCMRHSQQPQMDFPPW